ncbi:hypothetical protein [Rufibacter psychrotolerans]|uniref:hypothetical protein n=1 Tax=Rufibacter psychrotolerans TaxID=2812556 RepID=UPI0019682FE0|nr:hypothetical protein [Rufibacter sp. SYSU D00308]
MNITASEFHIVSLDDKYAIQVDNDLLTTPYGNVIAHESYRLMQHMVLELEGREEIDVSKFGYFNLLSTYIEFYENDTPVMSKEEFRRFILSDGVLKACAGPEKIHQFKKWGAMLRILEERSLEYPDLIQTPYPEDVEEWIGGPDSEYAKSVDELVTHFCNEFNLLSKQQKSVIISCATTHGSIIYAILLASKRCSELEYATAIAAGECLLPRVFDVEIDEYRPWMNELVLHANTVSNFVNFTLTPDLHTIDILRERLPNYTFLPEAARFALIEALNRINEANSDDYSSSVVLLGKALEVSLKEHYFDPFQIRFKSKFLEQTETRIFIEENGKFEKFARFLANEPHQIEFGSMLYVLEKLQRPSTRSNKVLSQFCDYLTDDVQKPYLISKEFVSNARQLAEARNKAAHSSRYTLTEARKMSEIALELLSLV